MVRPHPLRAASTRQEHGGDRLDHAPAAREPALGHDPRDDLTAMCWRSKPRSASHCRRSPTDECHVLEHFWGREPIVRRRGERCNPTAKGWRRSGRSAAHHRRIPPDTSFRGSPGKGSRPARIALHPAATIPAPAAAPDLARTPTAAPPYAGVSRDAGPHLTYSTPTVRLNSCHFPCIARPNHRSTFERALTPSPPLVIFSSMDHLGGCHCGNIHVRLRLPKPPENYAFRACTCSFCRSHSPRIVADPNGNFEIRADDWLLVENYRFGSKTCDFLICRRCGVFIAAVAEMPAGTRAVVNVNCLNDRERFTSDPVLHDFEGEALETRSSRRAANWMPAFIYR